MKSSSASVLSQLSKLVLGSACFVLAISASSVGVNTAKKALFADALSISPKLISWTGDLHPAFKSTTTNMSLQSPLDAVAANAFSDDVSEQVHQGLARIAHLEKVEHLAMRRARVIHSHVVIARAKTIQQDQVRVSQSVPELAKTENVPSAPATEAEKLQGVQAALVRQFFVAMNDLPKVNTQLAQNAEAVDTQAKIDSVLKLIAPQTPQPAAVKTEVIKKKKPVVMAKAEDTDETVPTAPVAPIIKKEVPLQTFSPTSQLASAASALKVGEVTSHLGTPVVIQPTAITQPIYPPSVPLVLTNTSTSPPATAPPTNNEDTEPGATYVGPSLAVTPAQPQSAVLSMAQSASKMWQNGYSQHAPVTTPVEYPKVVAQNTRIDTQKNVDPTTHNLSPAIKPTLTDTPAVQVKPAAQFEPARLPISPAMIVDKIGSSSSAPMIVNNPAAPPLRPNFGPLLDRTSRWAFHEAFDWNTSVVNPQVEILSQEGAIPDQVQARGQSAGQTLGWRIAKANQHWATLFWSTPNQEEVPMLNALSAKMLSVKAAATLQNDAGIILAKVPAGWTLEFSGRAERPLIFDRANHILAPSATEGSNGSERYYVFLNASPGEQILYLNHTGGETGALAIPVLGGVMAYADLTQVEKRTISGRILEAADSSPHGVPGIHVQVVGSGSSAVTGSTGDFHMDNVIAFGDQSLYLETETQKSFPHRYKLSPSAPSTMMHLSLFHLNEVQIHEWIGQLEGGVSSESGLILGALPTLAASQEDRKPVVGTRSLANEPTLTPETYTLSGSGQLMVKTPLNGVRSRFISVQVPEGPTLIEVVDKDNRLIWSEITVVSPRVLTVVGPY